METGGGLASVEMFATHTREFVLYGDGTVLFRPVTDMADPAHEGLPRLVRGQLDEEAIQALLRHALGAGRLLAARDQYPQNSCADCGFTTFALNAAGLEKTVNVDALGMADVPPDVVDRRGFAMLAETLRGFEQRARSGELGEASLYDPSHYRVFLFEGMGEPEQVGEWPWTDVTLDDFSAQGDDWRLQAVLDRQHVEMLVDVPSGGEPFIYVVDAADQLWQIAFRPLLPDELPATH